MKNKMRVICLLFIISILVTGCNGTVTRKIRQDGYKISSSKFKCSFLFSNKKDKKVHEDVKYLTDNYIISESGNIYEISIDGLYSNNMNCKKGGNLGTKVNAIMDNSVVRGEDTYFYYLGGDSASKYTRISTDDENYSIYKILLGESDTVKVATANSNSNSYYVLKKDGAIYKYILKKKEDSNEYYRSGSSIEVKRTEYGPIIDFNYAGVSLATFYRTNDSIYTMKITNSKECNKFVDVPCEYELKKDTVLNEYKDRIIAFDGKTIITDYGRVFSAGS